MEKEYLYYSIPFRSQQNGGFANQMSTFAALRGVAVVEHLH